MYKSPASCQRGSCFIVPQGSLSRDSDILFTFLFFLFYLVFVADTCSIATIADSSSSNTTTTSKLSQLCEIQTVGPSSHTQGVRQQGKSETAASGQEESSAIGQGPGCANCDGTGG